MSELLTSLRRAVASRAAASASEAAGLLVVGAVAVTLLGLLWWQQRPSDSLSAAPASQQSPSMAPSTASRAATPAPPGSSPGPSDGAARAPSPAPTPEPLVVHVAGAVRQPGVYTLPAGARVVDAVGAAGGLRLDADDGALNLAEPLTDGAQVRVPEPGEEPLAAGGVLHAAAPDGAASAPAPLDLNAADASALEQLRGVGPVTAERIVAHREAIGGFRSVEELLDVRGIGEARLADIADHVMVP